MSQQHAMSSLLQRTDPVSHLHHQVLGVDLCANALASAEAPGEPTIVFRSRQRDLT